MFLGIRNKNSPYIGNYSTNLAFKTLPNLLKYAATRDKLLKNRKKRDR